MGQDAKQNMVKKIFSPELFVALFEELRDERVKALKSAVQEDHPELQRWKKLRCPVVLSRCEWCKEKTGPNREESVFCARCRKTRYCGRDHQKKDWPSHKQTCRPR